MLSPSIHTYTPSSIVFRKHLWTSGQNYVFFGTSRVLNLVDEFVIHAEALDAEKRRQMLFIGSQVHKYLAVTSILLKI